MASTITVLRNSDQEAKKPQGLNLRFHQYSRLEKGSKIVKLSNPSSS